MDKDQAADIQKRTFAILDAIREIESIAFECPKDERSRFSNPIGEIVVAARFGILETVYARFPELRANDKQEEPHVSSVLKWSDVTLPKSITAADLDTAIFSVLKKDWLKTVRIIINTAAACKDRLMPIDDEVIGARIQALADEGRIDAQGNLSMWRHSEVRLRPNRLS